MIAALLVAAQAGPIGYRQHPASPDHRASVRAAVVVDEVLIAQQVPRVRVGLGDHVSLDAQLALVTTTGQAYAERGVGRAIVQTRGHFRNGEDLLAAGLEVGTTAGLDRWGVNTFGSQSSETLGGWHAAGFIELEPKTSADVSFHVAAGATDQLWREPLLWEDVGMFLEIRGAVAVDLVDDWFALVIEQELAPHDVTALTTRALVRLEDRSGICLDVGAQQPLINRTSAVRMPQLVAQLSFSPPE